MDGRIHPESSETRPPPEVVHANKVVNLKAVLVNQKCYEAIYQIPVSIVFIVMGFLILTLPLAASPSRKDVVIDALRAANTNPDNPSAGTDWLGASSCLDSLAVMASFVKTMADNTEAGYPNRERLLLLSDNIQAHYVVLQYGVDEQVCLPAANLTTKDDELLPRCNMDELALMRTDPVWEGGLNAPHISGQDGAGDALVLYNDAKDDRAALLQRLEYTSNNARVMCQAARWAKLFVVLREVNSTSRLDVLFLHSLMRGARGVSPVRHNPMARAYVPEQRSLVGSCYAWTFQDGSDILLMLLWMAFILQLVWRVFDEANQLRIYRLAGGSGYVRNIFNVLDWIALMLVVVWAALMCDVTMLASKQTADLVQRPILNMTLTELAMLDDPNAGYTYAYAIGLVAMIILTSTVMQYLYVHRGLHAIALMFKKAWKQLVDVGAFMAYLAVTMAVALYITNTYWGNNKDFVSLGRAIQNVFLLAFGFYGWDTFSPDQQSFYTMTAAPIIIFWLLVIVLVVIAQNIILAVVADSYGAARDELAQREFPHDGQLSIFGYSATVGVCLLRLLWLRLFRRRSVHDAINAELGVRTDQVLRQMILAQTPQLTTLLVYFACDTEGNLQDTSPWQVDAGGNPLPEIVNISSALTWGQLVAVMDEAVACQRMQAFWELPFKARPFQKLGDRATWLADMIMQVYGVGPNDGVGLEVVGRRVTGDIKLGRRTTGTISPLRQSHGGGKEAAGAVPQGCGGDGSGWEGAASCLIKAHPGGLGASGFGGQVPEAAGGGGGAAAATGAALRPFNSWGRARGQLAPLPPPGPALVAGAAALGVGVAGGGGGQLEGAVQQLASDQQGLLTLVQQMAAEQSKLMQRLQVQQVLLERLTTASSAAAAAAAAAAGGAGSAGSAGVDGNPPKPSSSSSAAGSVVPNGNTPTPASGSGTAAAAAAAAGLPPLDPVRSRAEVRSPIKEYIQSSSSSGKDDRGSKEGHAHASKP